MALDNFSNLKASIQARSKKRDVSQSQLAEYIQQRESEYARGVSTYKHEADAARQLNEAIAPFMPNLQKHGMEPTQWIRNLGTAHERLALGSPQDKIQTAAQLIRDYGIDPQGLFQMLSNPQQQAPQPQAHQWITRRSSNRS